VGASHLAFQVNDIQAAQAELERKGVEFYSGINVVDDGVLAGWRWVYFADPDGYPLELVENAYERPGGHTEGIARYLQTRPANKLSPGTR
jgi:catechol 2,3-dioxygenase-like lactoylglutathione lyase family enzyme